MSNDVREQLRSHFLIRTGIGTRRESLSLGCSSIKLPLEARHRDSPPRTLLEIKDKMNYIFDYDQQGATPQAQLQNGAEQCLVKVAKEEFVVTQIANCPHKPHDTDETAVVVPVWWFIKISESAFYISADNLDSEAFAADLAIHAQTLAYNLDAARNENWHLQDDGEPKSWLTPEAFAHDFGKWAQQRQALGVDVAPVTVYDDDTIDISNEAFPNWADWLNHLMLIESNWAGNARPWMRLQWLLYPFTPSMDLQDGDSDQAVLVKLIAAMATKCFPALADTSIRMAVVKLLGTEVPYQLFESEPWGTAPSLTRRCQYIHLISEWCSSARNEALLVQNSFKDVLIHYPELAAWTAHAPDPHLAAKQILHAGWGETLQLDFSNLGILNEQLAKPFNSGMWSEDRSANSNLEYLIGELRRRRAMKGVDAARPSAASDAGSTVVRGMASTDAAVQLAALSRALEAHTAQGGSDFAAIELMEKSEAVPALRFVRNMVPITSLPAAFETICRGFPAQMQEYFVDSMKHDDDGNLDIDLEDLTVSTFYTSDGAKKEDFYKKLLTGKVADIDWEQDFVAKIAKILNPDAKVYHKMVDAYADPTRRAMHVKYVGRALDCLGKLQSAPFSYSAVVGHWEPTLNKAIQRGAPADVLAQIDTLMSAVWRNAQGLFTASYQQGVEWQVSLIDENLSALKHFETWKAEFDDLHKLNKRFKATIEVRHAPDTTATPVAFPRTTHHAPCGGVATSASPPGRLRRADDDRPACRARPTRPRTAGRSQARDAWALPQGKQCHIGNKREIGYLGNAAGPRANGNDPWADPMGSSHGRTSLEPARRERYPPPLPARAAGWSTQLYAP